MKVIFSVLFAVDTDVFIRGKNVQELCIALNDIIRQPPIRTWSALSTLSHGKNRCIARSSAIILFIWWWWWRLWWRGINNMKLNGANICIFFQHTQQVQTLVTLLCISKSVNNFTIFPGSFWYDTKDSICYWIWYKWAHVFSGFDFATIVSTVSIDIALMLFIPTFFVRQLNDDHTIFGLVYSRYIIDITSRFWWKNNEFVT